MTLRHIILATMMTLLQLMLLPLASAAAAAWSSAEEASSTESFVSSPSSSSSSSLLTFFDHDHFGYPNVLASASAVITTRNEQQQQQVSASSSKNNNDNSPISLSSFATTPSPSSSSSSIPVDEGKVVVIMPKLCEQQPWATICQAWFIPTIAPSAYPSTLEPTTTMEPTMFPSVEFLVEKESVVMNSSTADTTSSMMMGEDDGKHNNNNNNTEFTTGTNANNNTNGNGHSTTTTMITYKLTPMDDTFLEVFRPNEALGSKTKLKVDAEQPQPQQWNLDDDAFPNDEAVPTKFIQLKFGLGQVLEEMMMMMAANTNKTTNNATITTTEEETEVELISAKLHLYALAPSSLGGYISLVPPPNETKKKKGKNKKESAVTAAAVLVPWNEESAVWNDYAKGGGGPGGGKKILPNDENPELGRIGQVLADQWCEADVSDSVLNMMNDEEKGNATKSLSLRISTNSTDGVIYASKEHPSGNGPYLELQFVVRNFTNNNETAEETTIANVTTATISEIGNNATSAPSGGMPSPSPSPTTIPVTDRPFEPDRTPTIENSTTVSDDSVVNTTSVLSSSFRMTITAIEPIRRGRKLESFLLRRDHRRRRRAHHPQNTVRALKEKVSSKAQQVQQPPLLQKEEPAVIEHLTRVYNEILTIPPIDVSLVYEDDLEVEYMGAENAKRDAGGVIRTSVFRVMAVFDQPEVSNMLSNDAAKVLDQATIYAFVGPEEEEFIKVLKNTGDPIVRADDDAEYDVTVLKVKYSKADKEGVQSASSANREDSMSDETGNDSLSSSSSSASWLNPTLIAGASAICLASAAAAILLWRQRHGGDYYSNNDEKEAGDSPRSFGEATVPSTPSPTGFIMDRFKNKKGFDYAEFEDVGMDAENPSTHNDASCPTATAHNNIHERPCVHPQLTKNIKVPECQNISFDDSSVSDVSAHVLGAKGKRVDLYANQAESLLLDASMESYNMEAMSALEHVRFENVLDMDEGYSLTSSTHRYTVGDGIARVTSDDAYGEDGSLSTGAVPSELYSNQSMDDSLAYSHDKNSSSSGRGDVAYAGHLFTLDMLRDKDKSLLVMPPPPSDIASDSSSQKDDLEEDCDDTDDVPKKETNERQSITQSITDELTKVMQLLRAPFEDQSDEYGVGPVSVDESVVHIGTVAGNNTGAEDEKDEDVTPTAISDNDNAGPPNTTVSEDYDYYDGLNVLMHDEPIVYGSEDDQNNKEPDGKSNYHLTQMNDAVSECTKTLDQESQLQNSEMSTTEISPTGDAATSDTTDAEGIAAAVVDDESSLVTQTLD